MQKVVPNIFIFALFFIATIAGCGKDSTTSASAPVALYAVFSPYSSSGTSLMGGAIQGGAFSAKFSNYSVSTLAGTAGGSGFRNYSGNSSDKAIFNQPNDITTDGTDFFVADYGNNVIRKVTPDGIDTTLHLTASDIPTGLSLPSGITTDGTYLYVVESGANRIRVIEKAADINNNHKIIATIGSADGLAGSVDSTDMTAARFNQPIGITTDGGRLFVTDFGNATVRAINTKNMYAVYTLAGSSGATGSADATGADARFNRPTRIATDGVSLYLTDFKNRTIRRIEPSSGIVTTIAGSPGQPGSDNGIGIAARFNGPNGITTDGTNLYVTDSYLDIIRKIVIATKAVTTLQLPGNTLHSPLGLTTDGSSLLVADTYFLNGDSTPTYSNSIIRIK